MELISCAVTAQLICFFVFAYANCWFSHAKAQYSSSFSSTFSFVNFSKFNNVMELLSSYDESDFDDNTWDDISETSRYFLFFFILEFLVAYCEKSEEKRVNFRLVLSFKSLECSGV